MTLKNQAITGIKWNTMAAILTIALQAIRLLCLSRLLRPEDFGLMAMVMIIIGFAQVYADAGVSAAIIYKQNATTPQLSSLYWLNIMVGVFLFLILLILTPPIVLIFGEPRITPYLRIVALSFIISPWSKQFEVMLQKELRFALLTKVQISALFVSTAVTLAAAFFKEGVWALVWGQLSLVSTQTSIFLIICWRQYRPTFHFKLSDLKGYLGFGMYQLGERSINFLAERFDQMLLGSLLGAQTLGFYNFAFNLVLLPIAIVNPIINKVAFPIFAKVQSDIGLLRKSYLKVLKMLSTINAPLLIGLFVVSPLAIPIIFGNQWKESIELVQVLTLVALSRSLGNPVGSLLLSKGRADLGFRLNAMLLIFNVVAIYVGLNMGGAIGAAISLLVIQILLQPVCYFYLIRPLIGKCGLQCAKSMLKPIFLSVIMAVVIFAFSLIHFVAWAMLLMQVFSGVCTYLVILWTTEKSQILEFRNLFFKPGINFITH
jgi:O-antigen/teichoic acid export membrane protein